ncbi:MAG: 30S ribosome-binding factor RbfA [Anaerolineae bacterium]
MSTRRQLRVAEQIRQELASMIIFDLRDPRLALVSVTRVQVSSDLRHADVYISSLEDDADAARGAGRAAPCQRPAAPGAG